MRAALAILLLAPALAGCLGGGSDSSSAPLLGGEGPAVGGNETAENASLPMLGPAVDPWLPGETERVLFEGTVEAGDCYTGAIATELVFSMYHMGGCALIELAEGALIPEGSRAVRIEADATQALKSGKYYSFMYTAVRYYYKDADEEPTAEKVHTAVYPLVPAEWDPPFRKWSGATMGYWSYTNGTELTVFVGPVKTRVVVERDLNWTPAAPIDHWSLPDRHRFPQPDVITVLDTNVTVKQPAHALASRGLATWQDWVPVQDRVPVGATQAVMALSWGNIRNCAPATECSMRADWRGPTFFVGGYSLPYPTEVGPTHALWVLSVPDQVPPDGDYANLSQEAPREVFPYVINVCPEAAETLNRQRQECKRAQTETEVEVRILLEAWRGDVDLDAVKARLGVA